MLNLDEIKYSMQNLMHRKLRSFLSMLSILIGIMSIFALVSFGIGIKHYVDTLASESGTDKLILQSKGIGAPGTDSNFVLTKDDVDYTGKIKGIKDYLGMKMSAGEIEFKGKKIYSILISMDPKKQDFMEKMYSSFKIISGRRLKPGELNKVVLGYNYQFDDKLFKRGAVVGDKVSLNGKEFEIAGFYSEVGNPQDDSQIYVTDEAYDILFPNKANQYGYIMMQAEAGVDAEQLADKVQDRLRRYKGQEKGKETFYVQTFADAIATFNSIISIITAVVFLIAIISVFVAAINIMNTMYTAVLERTREIGVMKAIGARNSKITMLFVFEAGILGLIGGIVGIILGYIIAKIGEYAAASAGYSSLQPYFPLYLIFGCVFFAFFVGALSGLLPALQAAKLKPVEALRYE